MRGYGWSWGRCLSFAWAKAREQRARTTAAPYISIVAVYRGNTRLILADNSSGFIFGDIANYLIGGLDEWRDNNSDNNSDIERLSLLAAELLDDCIGSMDANTSLSDTTHATPAPAIPSIAPTSAARMPCQS
jgi:hypothetical protein